MVSPVGPGDPLSTPTGGTTSSFSLLGTSATQQAFPDAPPTLNFIPVLIAPENFTIGDYFKAVNTSIRHLRDMEYYGIIVDELMTRRFYRSLSGNITEAIHTIDVEKIRFFEKILNRIERFVASRADLRGARIIFPNAYIQPLSVPNSPSGSTSRVALASVAIGTDSTAFQRLLVRHVIQTLLSIFKQDELNLDRDLRSFALRILSGASLFASNRTLLRLSGRIAPPGVANFQQPGATAVGATAALGFLEELRNIINAGVGADAVRQALGQGSYDQELVNGLTAAFNLSLLRVGLVLLGQVFGASTVQGILRLLPTLRPGGPQNVYPDFLALPDFDSILRTRLGGVQATLVGGLQRLIDDGVVSAPAGNLNQFVQEKVINQLTSVFHTPQQFIDSLEHLLMKATEQRRGRALRYLAFEAAAYVEDQLPFAIINKETLKRTIDRSRLQGSVLRDALQTALEEQNAARGTPGAVDQATIDSIEASVRDRLIRQSQLQQSIIQKNAIDYQIQKDRIRRDLIRDDAIRQSQIDRDNTLADVRDAVREDAIIERQRIEAEARNSFDLANRTVDALIQRRIIERAVINQRQLSAEIQRREIAQDDLNQRLLQVQIAFDQRQREAIRSEADSRRVLSESLQSVFASLDTATANAIAQTINLSIVGPGITSLSLPTPADIDATKAAFADVVDRRLKDLDVKDRRLIADLIKKEVIEDNDSFIRLIQDQIQKLREIHDQKISQALADENKELFDTFVDLGSFVVDRLLAPAYSLLYSSETSPMYAQDEKRDIKRNVDIMI